MSQLDDAPVVTRSSRQVKPSRKVRDVGEVEKQTAPMSIEPKRGPGRPRKDTSLTCSSESGADAGLSKARDVTAQVRLLQSSKQHD